MENKPFTRDTEWLGPMEMDIKSDTMRVRLEDPYTFVRILKEMWRDSEPLEHEDRLYYFHDIRIDPESPKGRLWYVALLKTEPDPNPPTDIDEPKITPELLGLLFGVPYRDLKPPTR